MVSKNVTTQTANFFSARLGTRPKVLFPSMNQIVSSSWRFLLRDRSKSLLLFLSIISLTACQSASSQQNIAGFPNSTSRIVTVSGRGLVHIPKTISQVRLGVEIQGKTSTEVQQQLAKRSEAVVELLKSSQEVEKLETTGINLTPNYSYKNGKQSITGYSGNNIVSFQIEPKKTGNLLDQAVKAGATKINNVTLVASDSNIADAQKQAIREASADANKQADAALSALDLKQREIIGIQINGANMPQPMDTMSLPYAQNRQQSVQGDATTPIVAGEQQVQAFVTLQIRY